MTAVIYARYSSDSQREASIEGQLRDCKDYAERNGITIVGTYIDRAYSAKTDDRPEFQRMVQDSAGKIFDAVLVWKLDRFARNRYDAIYYKRQLEKNSVHLVSVMEPISSGPEGIMIESLLIGMAEYYSAELAIKVAPRRTGKRPQMQVQRRRGAAGLCHRQRGPGSITSTPRRLLLYRRSSPAMPTANLPKRLRLP